MKYRKLRIAWSVFWGAMTVLMFVLWVQSYWWFNHAQYILPNNRCVALIAAQGVVCVFGGTSDKPIPKWVTSGVSSREITWKEDYWKSGHWNFASDYFKAPLRFLAVACGGMSALPWLPQRYSLRTIFIEMTVLAAVLVFVVWAPK